MPRTNWNEILPILPPKPRFGDACNQCGRCCIHEPCATAVHLLFQNSGPCQALEFEDGKTYCGLVRNPRKYIVNPEDAYPKLRFLKGYWNLPGETMEELLPPVLGIEGACDAIARIGPDYDIPYTLTPEEKDALYAKRRAERKP